MRNAEEIKKEYEETLTDKDNFDMVEITKNCFEFKNEARRRELKQEYNALLPENKKLAIYIHASMCKDNHSYGCSWGYEDEGLLANWEGYAHKTYLNKANEILACVSYDNAVKVLDVIKHL